MIDSTKREREEDKELEKERELNEVGRKREREQEPGEKVYITIYTCQSSFIFVHIHCGEVQFHIPKKCINKLLSGLSPTLNLFTSPIVCLIYLLSD